MSIIDSDKLIPPPVQGKIRIHQDNSLFKLGYRSFSKPHHSTHQLAKPFPKNGLQLPKDLSPLNAARSKSKPSLDQSLRSSSHLPSPMNKFKIKCQNKQASTPLSRVSYNSSQLATKRRSRIDRSNHRSTINESRLEQFDGIESYNQSIMKVRSQSKKISRTKVNPSLELLGIGPGPTSL